MEIKIISDYYYNDVLKNQYKIKTNPTKENIDKTQKTIKYLKECEFRTVDILREVSRHKELEITGESLSDYLWKDSLIKRGAFYLHRELRLVSPPPIYDFVTDTIKTFDFYCEMKIRYTVNNVLKYFYSRINSLNLKLIEERADRKAVDYMMKLYKSIDYVEPLDIILTSIDRHTEKHEDCYRLIDICNDNIDIIKELQSNMVSLESKDLRRIIWR